ncbi:MAG: FKBP-type peptidyl-prolyl cis-trans isomerase [Bacteroidetes bacterium]|nr:MAG: FKBP-type peptidyl-prolyl cis-trans isomerase [Bacteroidota bacterium]
MAQEDATAKAAASATEKNDMSTVSYNLGILVAQNLKQQGMTEIDAEQLASGVADALAGEEKVDLMTANQSVQTFMQAQQAKQFADVKAKGEAFLAENAKRPEVQVTESGLQYEILKPGSGPKPGTSDRVKVHYHGTLIDGTVFDSSVQRDDPATFGVTQVIQGWVEGLQLMPLGAKYKFYIPYQLAYGERGAGPKIPPYATLIFEVELLEIL